MKLALSSLKRWINYPLNASQLAEQLTLAGFETTIIPSNSIPFDGVVVGEIIDIMPHHNADRLRICTVGCGASSPKTIVCGANNVRIGLKVATALIGAKLPGGLVIQTRTIRKAASEGMLCSVKELELEKIFPEQSTISGILELPDELSLGRDLWKQLGLGESILHSTLR